MEPPDPSDEFNIPQEYADLVFAVRRAAVSLFFQYSYLDAFRGRPGCLLERMFRVCGQSPGSSSARQPFRTFRSFFTAIFMAFRRLLWGASKVRISYQSPEVGRLRSFLGTVPLSPVWCGPAWHANSRVYEIVIRF